ncbi:MAG: PIN domain-containing protein [Steroidobacteraceae bacterium]
MTAPCFVDANVLVYAYDPSEPLKREVAAALLSRLWRESSGRTSIQALNEFYSVRTCKLAVRVDRAQAWAELENFFQWNPRPLDPELLQSARQIEQRYQLNWWDCLIVAAAQLQGCAVLYTEDLQHGAIFNGVRVVNPFLAEVHEEPALYRVEPVSRHRPRGRPRKVA